MQAGHSSSSKERDIRLVTEYKKFEPRSRCTRTFQVYTESLTRKVFELDYNSP